MMGKLALVLMLFYISCGPPRDMTSFVHPDADFSYYQKVGVLPFKNQSEDRLAGEKVTEQFMTELLTRQEIEIMDPGQLDATVSQVLRIAPGASSTVELSPQQLSQVGEAAGLQGIIMGTIHDYQMIEVAGERYPMISMTLKLIDASTGKVVWQNSITETGGPNLPVVSIGEKFTLAQLTQKVSREVVSDFFSKAGVKEPQPAKKTAKAAKPAKPQKPGKAEKSQKSQKSDKQEKSEKDEKKKTKEKGSPEKATGAAAGSAR